VFLLGRTWVGSRDAILHGDIDYQANLELSMTRI
jgi:hypothetical protein